MWNCGLIVTLCLQLLHAEAAWTCGTNHVPTGTVRLGDSRLSSTAAGTRTWFANDTGIASGVSLERMKAQVLQLGAALDRGQSYNPTSGSYYQESIKTARSKIESLLEAAPDQIPCKLEEMEGEWELVLSTVPHGIFRSSPFFLAIQESYEYSEEKGKFFLFLVFSLLKCLSRNVLLHSHI
jgi:hypothetical protein